MTPRGSCVVEYVAWPDAFSVPVPSVVVPLRNVTVPVGIAVPEAGVTVAVKVMLVPLVAMAAEAVSAVVVPIRGGPAALTSNLEIKAFPCILGPGFTDCSVVWNAPLVTGKSTEIAFPATYTLFALSSPRATA